MKNEDRARKALLSKYGVRFDEDGGRWVTTEEGHRVHINSEGEPDKGNPHVIEKMSGETAKKSRGQKGSGDDSINATKVYSRIASTYMEQILKHEKAIEDIESEMQRRCGTTDYAEIKKMLTDALSEYQEAERQYKKPDYFYSVHRRKAKPYEAADAVNKAWAKYRDAQSKHDLVADVQRHKKEISKLKKNLKRAGGYYNETQREQ